MRSTALRALKHIVRGSVEETLNALLDAEADRLVGARRYERSEALWGTRVSPGTVSNLNKKIYAQACARA